MCANVEKTTQKKQLRDLNHIENLHFREFFRKVILHSYIKSVCFSNNLIELAPQTLPSKGLKFLASRLTWNMNNLEQLSRVMQSMQFADIFNYLILDHNQVDLVVAEIIRQLHAHVAKLKQTPYKFIYFKMKV